MIKTYIKNAIILFSVLLVLSSCSSMKNIAKVGVLVGNVTGFVDDDATDLLLNATDSIAKAAEDISREQDYYICRSVAAHNIS